MASQVVYGYPPPLNGQYGQPVQVQEKVEDGLSAAVSNMSIAEKPFSQAPPSYPQQVPTALPSPPISVKSHPVTHSPVAHSPRGSIYHILPGQVSSPATVQTPPAYPSPALTPITSPTPSSVSTIISHTPTTATYIPPPPPPLQQHQPHQQQQQHVAYTTSPVVTTPVSATRPLQPKHLIRRPVGQSILIPGRHPQPHPRVVYPSAQYPPSAASPLPSYNPSTPQPLAFAPPPTEASNPSPVAAATSSKRRSLLLGGGNTSFTAGVVTGLVSTKEFAKDGREKVGRWSRKTLDSLAGAAGYVPAKSSAPGGSATATATATGVCVPALAASAGGAAPGSGNSVTVSQMTSVNIAVPQGPITNGVVANGVVINGGIPMTVGQPPRPVVMNNVTGRPQMGPPQMGPPQMGPPQMVATQMMLPGGGPVLQLRPPVNPGIGPAGPGVMPNVRPNMLPGPGPMMGPGIAPMMGPGNGLAMNPVMQRPGGPYIPPGAMPMMAPGQRVVQQPPQTADDNIALGARILASGLTAYNRENNAAGGQSGGSGEHASGGQANEEHLGAGHAQHGEAYGQGSAMTGEHASGATGSTMHETAYANGPMDQTYGSSEATMGYSGTTSDQATYMTGDTGTTMYADNTVYSNAGTNQAEYISGDTNTPYTGQADQSYTSSTEQQAYTPADQTYSTTTAAEPTTYADPNSTTTNFQPDPSYAQYQPTPSDPTQGAATIYADPSSSSGGYTETSAPYADTSTATTTEYAYVSDTAAYASGGQQQFDNSGMYVDTSGTGMMYADQQQQVDYGYGYGYDYSGGSGVVMDSGYAGGGVVYDSGAGGYYDGSGGVMEDYGGGGGGGYDMVGESMSADVASSCLDLI
ncbi:hypothetical protein F4775DRAFT_134078 [Biscogniauxia sp. FL1348]|nr:hypothetical protein F4775DRAFT_134078 [Biscogniauxia sp. FL1348]